MRRRPPAVANQRPEVRRRLAETARPGGGTDHMPFEAVGLPGFEFIQDPLHYSSKVHLSDLDVYEEAVPGDLKQAAAILASFVYQAAMRDAMLRRKPLPKPRADAR